MLNRKLIAALPLLGFIGAAQAAFVPAELIADYQLNGDGAEASGGPMLIANGGSSFDSTGLNFGVNSGPTVTGDGTQTLFTGSPAIDYSIEIQFRLDSDTYSNNLAGGTYPFVKVFDYQDRTLDQGLYISNDGTLEFRGHAINGFTEILPEIDYHLIFTRSNDLGLQAYIDGVAQFRERRGTTPQRIDDTAGLAIVNSDTLNIFLNDTQSADQMASGFIDFTRVYSGTLTDEEAVALAGGGPPPGASQVPLPSSALLMLFAAGWLRKSRQAIQIAN